MQYKKQSSCYQPELDSIKVCPKMFFNILHFSIYEMNKVILFIYYIKCEIPVKQVSCCYNIAKPPLQTC